MPRRATVAELTGLLEAGQFAALIDIREDAQIEFKSQLNLGLAQDRHKLLKAVAALANTSGGLIVIGVETEQDIQSRVDFAARLVYLSEVNVGTYYQILSKFLYPRVQVAVEVYGQDQQLLVSVRVEQMMSERPVLVTHTIGETLNGGTVFGYYTRTEVAAEHIGFAEIHSLLQAGKRMDGIGELGELLTRISGRLDEIEKKLEPRRE